MIAFTHDKVVVHYQCPECKYIHNFNLKDSPGDSAFICDKCMPPEDCSLYEPIPDVIGISIKKT